MTSNQQKLINAYTEELFILDHSIKTLFPKLIDSKTETKLIFNLTEVNAATFRRREHVLKNLIVLDQLI